MKRLKLTVQAFIQLRLNGKDIISPQNVKYEFLTNCSKEERISEDELAYVIEQLYCKDLKAKLAKNFNQNKKLILTQWDSTVKILDMQFQRA